MKDNLDDSPTTSIHLRELFPDFLNAKVDMKGVGPKALRSLGDLIGLSPLSGTNESQRAYQYKDFVGNNGEDLLSAFVAYVQESQPHAKDQVDALLRKVSGGEKAKERVVQETEVVTPPVTIMPERLRKHLAGIQTKERAEREALIDSAAQRLGLDLSAKTSEVRAVAPPVLPVPDLTTVEQEKPPITLPRFLSGQPAHIHAKPYIMDKKNLDALVNSNNPYLTHLNIKRLDSGEYRVSSPDPVAHEMIKHPEGIAVSAESLSRILDSSNEVLKHADFRVINIPSEERVGDRAYKIFTNDRVAFNLARAIGANLNEADISAVISVVREETVQEAQIASNVVPFTKPPTGVFGGLKRLAAAASIAIAGFFGTSESLNNDSYVSTKGEASFSDTQKEDLTLDLAVSTASLTIAPNDLGGLGPYIQAAFSNTPLEPNPIIAQTQVSSLPSYEPEEVSGINIPVIHATYTHVEPAQTPLFELFQGANTDQPLEMPEEPLDEVFLASQFGTLSAIAQASLEPNASASEVLAQIEVIVAANAQEYPSLITNPDFLAAAWELVVPARASEVTVACNFEQPLHTRFAQTHCRLNRP